LLACSYQGVSVNMYLPRSLARSTSGFHFMVAMLTIDLYVSLIFMHAYLME
jgi:hypothetical protein